MKDLELKDHATMSSLEIAKLTEKEHANVIKDIRRILEEAEIDAVRFNGVYIGANGQERPCFNLPRFECDLVVSGYSVKYRAAIIKRWHELETAAKPARMPTHLETARLLVESLERVQALDASNAALATALDREFGYCSILRVATFTGLHESSFKWQTLKRVSAGMGLEVRRVASPRYGYQCLYALKAWNAAYPDLDLDGLEPDPQSPQDLAVFAPKRDKAWT
jgi:phage regulator Rha-like protein